MSNASAALMAWVRGLIVVGVSGVFVFALWAGWFGPMFGWAGDLIAEHVPRPSLQVREDTNIIIDSTIEPSEQPSSSTSPTPAPSTTA